MLDPDFPKRLLTAGSQRTMEFIHYLSKENSKCGLTEKTDRCVAISGLEPRIARTLGYKSSYGIFETYLHGSLFWQATDEKLERIAYKEEQYVPSWSWMAYTRGIRFFDKVSFNIVEWNVNLRFDEECEHALMADLGSFRDRLSLDGKHDVFELNGVERGWVRYDMKNKDQSKHLCDERCVPAGKMTRGGGPEMYYVLVFRPTRDSEYSRVGVGMSQSEYVVRDRSSGRVV
ncbi:hypothetical protein K505DRAFT_335682 [Melanomma pulvis-pyrius CBS 109.77]|uniref:Uncharacterized protein n=1 Tax=Melanomma pulvis-pyrius CBS 109.77 TaxID=1314802 RepID=A0A6A6XJU8_9PLEO|nr:hypothetical protein K505DRAFT_335682 [Melanomma pulvis-pyrius CBS 109.77]